MILAGRQQADILVLLTVQKSLQVLEMCVHATGEREVVLQEQGGLLFGLHKHPQTIHMVLSSALGGIGGRFPCVVNHAIQRCPHASQLGHGFLPTIPTGFQVHHIDDIDTRPSGIAFEDIMLGHRYLPCMTKYEVLGGKRIHAMQKVALDDNNFIRPRLAVDVGGAHHS